MANKAVKQRPPPHVEFGLDTPGGMQTMAMAMAWPDGFMANTMMRRVNRLLYEAVVDGILEDGSVQYGPYVPYATEVWYKSKDADKFDSSFLITVCCPPNQFGIDGKIDDDEWFDDDYESTSRHKPTEYHVTLAYGDMENDVLHEETVLDDTDYFDTNIVSAVLRMIAKAKEVEEKDKAKEKDKTFQIYVAPAIVAPIATKKPHKSWAAVVQTRCPAPRVPPVFKGRSWASVASK